MSGDMAPGRGRIPIGGRTEVFMSQATQATIRELSLQFGQRQFAAVVRIAIRRMLTTAPADLDERIAQSRTDAEDDRVRTPVFLGDALRDDLMEFSDGRGWAITQSVRMACEWFVDDLDATRREGRPIDLLAEMELELYRGREPNRSAIIARMRRRQEQRRSGENTNDNVQTAYET